MLNLGRSIDQTRKQGENKNKTLGGRTKFENEEGSKFWRVLIKYWDLEPPDNYAY